MKTKRYLLGTLLLAMCIISSYGQKNWCESVGNPAMHSPNPPPDPECNLDNLTPVCVKIKFHFINPTGNAMSSIADEEFAILLTQVNQAFRPGKIQLSLNGECVHRDDVTLDIETATDLYGYVVDEFGVLDPDPQLEYDEEAFNIYFVQGLVGRARANYPLRLCVLHHDHVSEPFRVIHEVGHLFSLDHTFGTLDGGINSIEDLANYCNDPEALDPITQEPLCMMYGDMICDTPVDPWSLDLDEDNQADQDKWGTCTLNPDIFNYLDGCGDNHWNPPFSNYMSYYLGCQYEFSPCQLGLANEMVSLDNPEVILTCEELSLDIVIDEPIIWEDITVELAPGQRIVITENGTLTLNNSKLTRKNEGPNENCLDLYDDFWDGIYYILKERAKFLMDMDYQHFSVAFMSSMVRLLNSRGMESKPTTVFMK